MLWDTEDAPSTGLGSALELRFVLGSVLGLGSALGLGFVLGLGLGSALGLILGSGLGFVLGLELGSILGSALELGFGSVLGSGWDWDQYWGQGRIKIGSVLGSDWDWDKCWDQAGIGIGISAGIKAGSGWDQTGIGIGAGLPNWESAAPADKNPWNSWGARGSFLAFPGDPQLRGDPSGRGGAEGHPGVPWALPGRSQSRPPAGTPQLPPAPHAPGPVRQRRLRARESAAAGAAG